MVRRCVVNHRQLQVLAVSRQFVFTDDRINSRHRLPSRLRLRDQYAGRPLSILVDIPHDLAHQGFRYAESRSTSTEFNHDNTRLPNCPLNHKPPLEIVI